jgi:hypothetical protein
MFDYSQAGVVARMTANAANSGARPALKAGRLTVGTFLTMMYVVRVYLIGVSCSVIVVVVVVVVVDVVVERSDAEAY